MTLGREAIVRGHSNLFVPATGLPTQLARAHAEGRLVKKLLHFTKPKLLVVYELCHRSYEASAAYLFLQLISRRDERGSMLVTSNRSVAKWCTVFGYALVATEILDQPRTTATSSRFAATATGLAQSAVTVQEKTRSQCFISPRGHCWCRLTA